MTIIGLSKKCRWKTCENNNTHKLLDRTHKLDQILTIDFYDYFNFAYLEQIKMIYYKNEKYDIKIFLLIEFEVGILQFFSMKLRRISSLMSVICLPFPLVRLEIF